MYETESPELSMTIRLVSRHWQRRRHFAKWGGVCCCFL